MQSQRHLCEGGSLAGLVSGRNPPSKVTTVTGKSQLMCVPWDVVVFEPLSVLGFVFGLHGKVLDCGAKGTVLKTRATRTVSYR